MQRDDLQQRQRGGGGNVEEQGLDSARLGSVRTFAGGRRAEAQHAARVGQDDGPVVGRRAGGAGRRGAAAAAAAAVAAVWPHRGEGQG
eukprot:scaffold27328_cov67-Phaeocystis_antarctica.AAC.2